MPSETSSGEHQLRFASLCYPGHGVSVPCDSHGEVHMDELPERLRNAYLGARALMGREYDYPVFQTLH